MLQSPHDHEYVVVVTQLSAPSGGPPFSIHFAASYPPRSLGFWGYEFDAFPPIIDIPQALVWQQNFTASLYNRKLCVAFQLVEDIFFRCGTPKTAQALHSNPAGVLEGAILEGGEHYCVGAYASTVSGKLYCRNVTDLSDVPVDYGGDVYAFGSFPFRVSDGADRVMVRTTKTRWAHCSMSTCDYYDFEDTLQGENFGTILLNNGFLGWNGTMLNLYSQSQRYLLKDFSATQALLHANYQWTVPQVVYLNASTAYLGILTYDGIAADILYIYLDIHGRTSPFNHTIHLSPGADTTSIVYSMYVTDSNPDILQTYFRHFFSFFSCESGVMDISQMRWESIHLGVIWFMISLLFCFRPRS